MFASLAPERGRSSGRWSLMPGAKVHGMHGSKVVNRQARASQLALREFHRVSRRLGASWDIIRLLWPGGSGSKRSAGQSRHLCEIAKVVY